MRDEFGRVAYSHKTHEKMADRLNSRVLWEKRINAALLALTTGNTIAVLVVEARWVEVTNVVLVGLSLYVTVYGYSRNRDRLVDQHRQAALGLRFLRDRYIHLIADVMTGSISEEEGRRRRDDLSQQLNQAYASAPPTDPAGYAAARRPSNQRGADVLGAGDQRDAAPRPPDPTPPVAPPPAGASRST
ncbi:SLATT domain-containing protein [Cystobacter fuscus]